MEVRGVIFKSKLYAFLAIALSAIFLLSGAHTPAEAGQTEYVIVISVDGGGSSYIQSLISGGQLPNFKKLQDEGAWTHNARCDHDISVTLPNHTTMVTARGIYGINSNGHMWTSNTDPSSTTSSSTYSIQSNKGSYVYSVFDVAHDNGLRTAMYATKTKFSLFDHSFNNGYGAADTTGDDNGRNKITAYVYNSSSATNTANFIAAMKANPYNFAFVHYTDTDTAGHASGWGSSAYNNALIAIDGYIGQILNLVETDSSLKGKTSIIVTADHGGSSTNHNTASAQLNYTIPIYIWGPDAQAAADLYDLNTTARQEPGTGRLAYTAAVQPIRHADSANLALRMLSLEAIPDSTINPLQDLLVNSRPPVNGVCGSAHGQYLSEAPASDLCSAGTASAVSGSGPWTWKCVGEYLGYNVNCSAELQTYQLTAYATGSGSGNVSSSAGDISISYPAAGSDSAVFYYGASVTLTATATTGSTASWSGDCSATGSSDSVATCTISSMNAAKTVTATFSSTPVNGVCGASNSGIFTAAPTSGLCSTGTASAVSGTGPWTWTCAGSNGGDSVSCSANIQQWTVTPSAGSNGFISPSSSQTVNHGSVLKFTVTPNSNYYIGSVTGCNGSLNGSVYTTGAIIANCQVIAVFTLEPVNGVCGSSNGGTFTTAPTSGFCSTGTASSVSGTGPWTWTCSGSNNGTTASCSARIQTYALTAIATGTGSGSVSSSSGGVSISYPAGSSGAATFNYGTAVTLTAMAATGSTVTWSGSCSSTGGTTSVATCAISSMNAAKTVTATFTLASVNGACGSSNGGTFTSAPTSGLCSTGTASSVSGSGAWSWTCAGSNGGSSSSCLAKIQQWTVTPSAGSNGSISPSSSQGVNHGSSVKFTVTPNSGYYIGSVTGCNGTLSGSAYTTGAITANCQVTATFTKANIVVTYPNGEETWKRESTYKIRWTYTGNPGSYVKIELLKGGVVKRTITSKRTVGSSGSGYYNWEVPSGQTLGKDYTVRITSTSNSSFKDVSNTSFTIVDDDDDSDDS